MSGFNGSGTFQISGIGLPFSSGSVISSSVVNTLNQALADGLTNCITKDGQQTVTADISFNTHRLKNVADATATSDAINMSQMQSGAALLVGSVAGTNTITGSLTPAITSYVNGCTYRFFAAGNNTGAVTLSINSVGAKAITKNGTTALEAGDISTGVLVTVTYDGTQFQLNNVSSFSSATINAATFTTSATFSFGTANYIPYLNGSKQITFSSALQFNGTDLTTTGKVTGSALVPTGSTMPANGFYFPAANTIALAINSVQAWRADSNGYMISDLANYAMIQGASWASTSGTSHDWTGIPSWAKKITIMFSGVSNSGSAATDVPLIRLGTGVGPTFSATGYQGCQGAQLTTGVGTKAYSVGFLTQIDHNVGSTYISHGIMTLTNITGNLWAYSCLTSLSDSSRTSWGAGSIALGAALTGIKITTETGSSTFSAGTVSILVE